MQTRSLRSHWVWGFSEKAAVQQPVKDRRLKTRQVPAQTRNVFAIHFISTFNKVSETLTNGYEHYAAALSVQLMDRNYFVPVLWASIGKSIAVIRPREPRTVLIGFNERNVSINICGHARRGDICRAAKGWHGSRLISHLAGRNRQKYLRNEVSLNCPAALIVTSVATFVIKIITNSWGEFAQFSNSQFRSTSVLYTKTVHRLAVSIKPTSSHH